MARFDLLVVVHVNLRDVTGRLRADLNDVTVDECVVSRFVRTSVKPVTHAHDRADEQDDGGDNQNASPFIKRTLCGARRRLNVLDRSRLRCFNGWLFYFVFFCYFHRNLPGFTSKVSPAKSFRTPERSSEIQTRGIVLC